MKLLTASAALICLAMGETLAADVAMNELPPVIVETSSIPDWSGVYVGTQIS
ncbi:hypothetical protein [Mesorhizobium helmanticense]|uniref:hypothetical protein n=1 Tax=Mesorhizobium helmanticense TaxID=1776423 RepID=UPI00142E3D98|nr:hypothetical protein [Mesorhizobium helmanticense]